MGRPRQWLVAAATICLGMLSVASPALATYLVSRFVTPASVVTPASAAWSVPVYIPIRLTVENTTVQENVRLTFVRLGTHPGAHTVVLRCTSRAATACALDYDIPHEGLIEDGGGIYAGQVLGHLEPLPFGTYNLTVSVVRPGATDVVIVERSGINLTVPVIAVSPTSLLTITPRRTSQLDFGIEYGYGVCDNNPCPLSAITSGRTFFELRNASHLFAASTSAYTRVLSLRNKVEVRPPSIYFTNPPIANPLFVPPGLYTVRLYMFNGTSQSIVSFEFTQVDVGYDTADYTGQIQLHSLISDGMQVGGPAAALSIVASLPILMASSGLYVKLLGLDGSQQPVAYNMVVPVTSGFSINTDVAFTSDSSQQLQWTRHREAETVPVDRVPFGVYNVTVGYVTQWGEATSPRTFSGVRYWPTAPARSYDSLSRVAADLEPGYDADNMFVTDEHVLVVTDARASVYSTHRVPALISTLNFTVAYAYASVSFVLPHIVIQDQVDHTILHLYYFNATTGTIRAVPDDQAPATPYNLWTLSRLQPHLSSPPGRIHVVWVGSSAICFVNGGGRACFGVQPESFVQFGVSPVTAVTGWNLGIHGTHDTVGVQAVRVLRSQTLMYVFAKVVAGLGSVFRYFCVVDISRPAGTPSRCESVSQLSTTSIAGNDTHVFLGSFDTPDYCRIRVFSQFLNSSSTTLIAFDRLNGVGTANSPRALNLASDSRSNSVFVALFNGEVFELKDGNVMYYRRVNTNAYSAPNSISRVFATTTRLVLVDTVFITASRPVDGNLESVRTDYARRVSVFDQTAVAAIVFNPTSNIESSVATLPLEYALFDRPRNNTVVLEIRALESDTVIRIPMPDSVVMSTNMSAVLGELLGPPLEGDEEVLGVPSTSHAKFSTLALGTEHAGTRMRALSSGDITMLLEPGVFSFEIVYISYFSNATVRSTLSSNVTLTTSAECGHQGVYLNKVCYCQPGWSGVTCAFRNCEPQCNAAGGTCNGNNGTCACNDGWAGATCDVRVCTPSCHPVGGVCNVNGTCTCAAGWTGPSCSAAQYTCNPPCYHAGHCTASATCGECLPGWGGSYCDVRLCSPACDPAHGTCRNNGTCACQANWGGAQCNIPLCGAGCGDNGVCSPTTNTCTCDAGWGGAQCDTPLCAAGCGSQGICVAPNVCECEPTHTGARCHLRRCPDDCSSHGQCDGATGTCVCSPGWSGIACSVQECQCGPYGVCFNATAPTVCTCTAVPATATPADRRYGTFCNDTLNACTIAHCEVGASKCASTILGRVSCTPVQSPPDAGTSSSSSSSKWKDEYIHAIVGGIVSALLIVNIVMHCVKKRQQPAFSPLPGV